MVFSVLSFVSRTYLKLKTDDSKHQAVKKTKRNVGLPFSKSCVIIGKRITTIAALIQLVAVDIETILG